MALTRGTPVSPLTTFAATWTDLETIILSELSHTKTDKHGITYMCDLKYDTNELVYKTDSQI